MNAIRNAARQFESQCDCCGHDEAPLIVAAALPDPLVCLRQSRRALLRNLRAQPDTLAAFLLPQALGSYRRQRAVVMQPVVLP